MKLPPLVDDELNQFLRQGTWIGKLATHKADGAVRITPLGYAAVDGAILFSTWDRSDAAANLRHDPRASVLIDRPDPPYRGIHYVGTAEVTADSLSPQTYGELFGRYVGGPASGAEYYRQLAALGLGDRVTIRFVPEASVTWDFSKLG